MSAGASSSAPAFVQQVTAHSGSVSSLALTPGSNITAGNRLVVEVGVWNDPSATAARVSDSAGNIYTEVLHFTASDHTEMSVWTAPVTAGGGTRPTVTVTPSAKADVGAVLSEYSGLSTAAGASAVDVSAHASGTTGGAATVASGSTPGTSAAGELAVGMYADSGFGDTLTPGSGWTQRANASNNSNIELLSEDQVLGASGATPSATAATGGQTTWLMATVVFALPPSSTATAPSAPSGVTVTPGDGSATVSWTAPSDGGSPLISYTVTPYIGATAQTPTTVGGSPLWTNTTIKGLSDGTAYTFTVTATNAIGTSPASSPVGTTPTATSGGQWSTPMNWPMVAVHSVLLDTGKVLQWDGWQQPEPTQVWDPSTQTFTTQTAPDSIFCSGMAELPDGRVLVVGGYGGLSTGNIGIADTSIFDPTTSTWTRVANMHSPRWYPDLTELPDGTYVAISGNTTDASHWADTPEVYNPSTNTWTVLSKVDTSQVHEEEYPFSYLAPNGDVFTIGPSEDVSFFLNVQNQTWTQVGGASGVVNGSSVMYRPGQILYSGGTSSQNSSSPANATAATIDLTAPSPTWQQTSPMLNARVYHTLTTLADGTVLAVGGESTWGQTGNSEVSGGVLPSEIWNPTTRAWSPAAAISATRGYHSTAILMPDGTVLVSGSGHAGPGEPGQDSAQIYSPPYLFKGARPTITSAPSDTTYGSNIPVSTPDAASISAVNLVSLGADTHQSDMDQHFVPLSFTQSGGGLNVQMPSSATIAPPGNYMLFILNSAGVPSEASFIHLTASQTAPSAPSAVSAIAGNGSATLSWTAPSDGNSPITSYTVTPYAGTTALPTTTVSGSPPATNATITGLTNGTAYTFTVTATNAIGTGPPSAPSNAVTPSSAPPPPAFVQGVSGHAGSVTSLSVTPPSTISAGNRLIVETGVWNSAGATMSSVTDSAGDHFTELLHYKASDKTEISVWSAPITAGGGTQPTITATPSSKADVGVAALEYSGLSTVADATVVDQSAHAAGTTTAAKAVASGATAATTAGDELALGLYADSGFGDTLTAGSGFTPRINVSNTSDIELLAEDQVLAAAGATPNATVGTGATTTWLMATVVLKGAGTINGAAALQATASPATPTGGATSGLTAHVLHRQLIDRRPTTATRRHVASRSRSRKHVVRCTGRIAAKRSRACVSLRRAARITAAARAEFIYSALLRHLPKSLFCYHGRALRAGGDWTAWFHPTRPPAAHHSA
jgi:Galactose oxidase-like, Early set domain/Fibronectin type III domain/Glyoxal oxidase N-terminus